MSRTGYQLEVCTLGDFCERVLSVTDEPDPIIAMRPADEALNLIELYDESGVDAWVRRVQEEPPSRGVILTLTILARNGLRFEAERLAVPLSEVTRQVRLQAMDAVDEVRGDG